MRRLLILSGALLAAPILSPGAQTVRWNDRSEANWQLQAPRVRVSIVGSRSVALGAPVLVQFEVSDDAYVTVARVDGNGRMTILYPTARQARAAVKGGQIHYARNSRLGFEGSFVATERTFGGYVFAIASFAPLDLSGFENRDFERFGAYSRFTQVNRTVANRPEIFVDRFAGQVLWEPDTPFDFDVDYYYPWGQVTPLNAYALCGAVSRHGYGPMYTLAYDWDAWDSFTAPYSGLCNSYWNDMRCLSMVSVFGNTGCYRRSLVAVLNPATPGDTASVPAVTPNSGVVRGGLVTPTPVPVAADPDGDPPPLERRQSFDEALRGSGEPDWDSYLAIPARATRKLKSASGSEGGTTTPSGTASRTGASSERAPSFDGAATRDKPDKDRVADAGSAPPSRAQPPSREAERAKPTTRTEPRRTTGTRTTGGSSSGDRASGNGGISRPVSSRPSGTTTTRPTPTIKPTGSSTTKTKPPSDKK